jgi:hypothetical protein
MVLSCFFISFFRRRTAWVLIVSQALVFVIASYVLLTENYVWNYSLFPCTTIFCTFIAEKIYRYRNPLINPLLLRPCP